MKTTITKNHNKGNALYGANKLLTFLAFVLCLGSYSASASQNTIESIQYDNLPGNRLQITLEMSEKAVKPLSFTIDNPARIAFDFADTGSTLPKRQQPIGIGVAQSVTTISAKNRTRVILNLTEVIPYQVNTKGNSVLITLDSEATGSSFVNQSDDDTSNISDNTSEAERFSETDSSRRSDLVRGISKIDFRRGEKGEGRVIITMTENNIPMDISEEFGKVIVKFIGSELDESLHQSLDVLDFATPVKSISSFKKENDVRIEIEPATKDFEHVAYQADNIFTIELKPISEEELEDQKKSKFGYTGERLSLNFQDIPVRAVLQLIADFTGLNVVVSDSVDGNLTLRLKNVPWDQALDIILKAKGLSKRESGNVMLVAPSEEIAAQEKIDLEASQAITDLAPLRSAFFTVNFAKVTELKALFSGGEGEEAGNSLLSSRGSVIIDERTNTLILKDTEEVISEVRRILNKLDVPIRQVLIGSRIVIATDDFSKELGARFGVSNISSNGSDSVNTLSGTIGGTNNVNSQAFDNLTSPTNGGTLPLTHPLSYTGSRLDRLGVNLPVVGPNVGAIAFSVLSGGSLVDLEISAMQSENKGELVSSPRVVTADRHEAFIEQGVEIPYLSASSSGATTVEFKKAVLSIKVTPQITPDDRIIMDLTVNKDSVGEVFNNIPSVDTREVQTQVLVNNGDTIVLGGIYEQIKQNQIDKIPLLGDLPLIGFMFRHTLESDEKAELLIFVTPKILKDSLSL
ncbi:MAG: type IV pilus secretin PilQ [Gammaproteobacteria bacterium]|nr:type IV pilus secretin PilQ [Gammaproteobacteria bacterium]